MRRSVRMILLLGFVIPAVARAQPTCNEKDATLADCWQRIYDDHVQMAPSKTVEKKLKERPSTPDVPGTPSQSSTKDFLPPFLAAIQSAQLDNKNQELTITWNLPGLKAVDIQLQSVVHQPQLSQKLKDSLEASGRTAQETALQSKLNDLGDFSTMLSVNFERQNLGRKFENYRQLLFAPLFRGAISRVDLSKSDSATEAKNKVLQKIKVVKNDNPENLAPSAVDENTRQVIVESALAWAERESELSRQLSDANLSAFADLVDNQPQATITASQRHRNHNVGPDEFLVQGSVEFSPVSLNSYRHYLDSHPKEKDAGWQANCKDTADQQKDAQWQATCSDDAHQLRTYEEFMRETGASWLRSNGVRGKLSFEYNWINAYSLQLPADAVSINLARAHRLAATFNLGGRVLYQGKNIGKLDFEGRYENYSDDPNHRDRLVFDLTYTQKVSDSFSLPIGITYANHEQFLSDVQRRFSAHVALHAKIFGQ